MSSVIRDSFEAVISSKRLLEATENKAQSEKLLAVASAEAQAQAMKLNGQGIADQRAAIAGGFKEDFNKIKEAMPDVGDAVIANHLTQVYTLEAIKEASNNPSATILMPYEAITHAGQAATVGALTGATAK